ncbi:Lipocalin-like domain-containing protein [Zhouia amylolytica]|uniref:Lipocalin-like domain-containing protein n=1 Tax=Zhouia amylolytica TaxID=376730 RepID=A0A1I6UL24_9FLAO|nr:lipocalin family protein [Zhouia amylolytica]MCQ0112691.1 lipocalin family protein [Zhouia amylolytica]SFT02152.1 Lipocalin-like domain-containing protein [Zhouia amylolytica]
MNKKHILLITICSLILYSCSLSKENKETRKSIDGTWELTDVSYEGTQGYFKSTLFNDADSKCFKGSEWFFRSNNSTGFYNIMNDGCPTGQRNIRWSIQDVNGVPSQFQFKYIDEKKNDLNGGYGYVFKVASLNQNQMKLTTDVNVDGDIVTLALQYSRKSL